MAGNNASEERARKRQRRGGDGATQTSRAAVLPPSQAAPSQSAAAAEQGDILDKLPPMPRFARTNYKDFADSAVDYLRRPPPPKLPHLAILRALGRGAIADEIEGCEASGEPIPSSDKTRKLIPASEIIDKITRDYDEVDRLREKADGLAAGKTYPEDVPAGARDSQNVTHPNAQVVQGATAPGPSSQAFIARNKFRKKSNREKALPASSLSAQASGTSSTTTTITGAIEMAFGKPHQVIHINNNFSDGDASIRPPRKHVLEPIGARYRRDLAKYWMQGRGLAQPDVEYIVDALPANYIMTRNPTNPADRHIYIYGMPGGKRIQSAHKWYEHFEHMMLYSTTDGCSCEFCTE